MAKKKKKNEKSTDFRYGVHLYTSNYTCQNSCEGFISHQPIPTYQKKKKSMHYYKTQFKKKIGVEQLKIYWQKKKTPNKLKVK